MDEVIIDFGPDELLKIKSYICDRSFYVALTMVRKGVTVFLRSFDVSYIKVNPRIEEKLNAMISSRSYEFKKVYLNKQIFEVNCQECKVGYLNINGLLDEITQNI